MTHDIVVSLLANAAVFTVLFGLMLAMRRLLAKRISAALQYVLWAAVIIKLMIPFGFESELSPLNMLIETPAAQTEATAEIPSNSAEDSIALADVAPSYGESEVIPNDAGAAKTLASNTMQLPVIPAAARLAWQDWALMVWAAGVLAVGTGQVLMAAHLRRQAMRARRPVPERIQRMLEQSCREVTVKRKVRVVVQSSLSVPLVVGALRPLLVLPEDIGRQSNAHVRHVLLHELTHIHRGDLLVIALLNVLRAVYWFNPFTWLCFKLVRADMETACDARVISRIGVQARTDYISTVLRFTKQGTARRLTAAMGMADGRMTMEKRIRGMFRQTRTGLRARAAALMLVLLMLAAGGMTACQPTPEMPPVVNKGDNRLEEKIAATPQPAAPKESPARYGAPESVQEAFTAGNADIRINVDALVTVPDVEKIPVIEIVPTAFTQEEVDNLVTYFTGGKPLYESDVCLTKSQYEELIIQARSELALADDPSNDMPPREEIEAYIKRLERELQKTPETVERDRVDGKLAIQDGMDYETMEAAVYMGKEEPAKVYAQNRSRSVSAGTFSFENGALFAGPAENEQAQGQQLTPQQAAERVNAILRDLGIENREAVSIKTGSAMVGNDQPFVEDWQGYAITCRYVVNGIPVLDVPVMATGDEVDENGMLLYKPTWDGERIAVSIDDNGVTSFRWLSRGELGSVLNENVECLPFEEVWSRFKQQISFRYADHQALDSDGSTMPFIVEVERIELGYVVTPRKDMPDSYMLVPAWTFFGTEYLEHKDGTRQMIDVIRPICAINGIDGSVLM